MILNYEFKINNIKITDWEPYFFQNRSNFNPTYVRVGGKGKLCWQEGTNKFEEKFESTNSEAMQKIDENWRNSKFKVFGNLILKNGFGKASGKTYTIHNVVRVELLD